MTKEMVMNTKYLFDKVPFLFFHTNIPKRSEIMRIGMYAQKSRGGAIAVSNKPSMFGSASGQSRSCIFLSFNLHDINMSFYERIVGSKSDRNNR